MNKTSETMNDWGAMIPRSPAVKHVPVWQSEMARAITDPQELLGLLALDPELLSAGAARDFPLKVPRSFLARMEKGNPHDPLLRQVLPIGAELLPQSGYKKDPLQELEAMPVNGLLHKYQGRALLTITGACGIHCRYCFRRHFPYAETNPSRDQWHSALEYLRRHPEISEVLLSGGDPLSMNDRHLTELVSRLERISHIKRLRIHTRLAVVLPERIDGQLLRWLGATSLQTVVVVHVNHANEINHEVIQAMHKLRRANVSLLNQSVLLRGVNDDATILAELSERLFEANVLPYYLHQLDRVQGAAHFEVEDNRALEIMAELHAALPGYLVPRLCREEPGAPGKTIIQGVRSY